MMAISCVYVCGLEILVDCFNNKTYDIWEGYVIKEEEEGDLEQAHLFPRVSWYKRRSEIA